MVVGFVIGVVIAYFLTATHIDQVIISSINDITKFDIGQVGYYLIMGIAGGISLIAIGGFLSGIMVAYLLTWPGFDQYIIEAIKEWFNYDMSRGAYYLLFAVMGAAISFLEVVQMSLSSLFSAAKRKA
ncbi:MAG: hypothetical protein H7X79_03305 [Sporomusaceae bacterium]|nr:hypothetical protein [Sporomusaceae bacterium]